ncbi:MAG: PKD domain-containing protein, partial [Thermoplasmatota archaeon]
YPVTVIGSYSVDGEISGTIYEGSEVVFDGSESTDTQRDIDTGLEFKWTFDDPNSNGTNRNVVEGGGLDTVSHTFGDSGAYTVTLRVTDQNGAFTEDSVRITVVNTIPVPVISTDVDQFVEDGPIEFDSRNTLDSDHDLEIMEYSWDLGDGTVVNWTGETTIRPSYPGKGVYTVSLRARDDEGSVGRTSIDIEVRNVIPSAVIGDPIVNSEKVVIKDEAIEVVEDDVLRFSGSRSTDTVSDRDELEYEWRFGDGSRSDRMDPVHIYYRRGDYDVSLTVTDDDLDSGRASLNVIVNNIPPTADAGSGGTFQTSTIFFNASGTKDTPSDLRNLTYDWDFGDGERGAGAVAYHRYGIMGTFDILLTVTDDDGAASTDRIFIKIENLAPIPVVSYPPSVNEDEVFRIDASGSSDPDGGPVAISWTAEDGSIHEGPYLDHVLHRSGLHTIILSLRDDEGAVFKESIVIEALNLPPTADAGSDNETLAGTYVTLDGRASNDTPSDRANLTYVWTFPDNTTLIGEVVEYVFEIEGVFEVILDVIDDDGVFSRDRILIHVRSLLIESIEVTLELDPGKCRPGETVRAFGRVAYVYPGAEADHAVSFAFVKVSIGSMVFSVKPDRNGYYQVEFEAPEETGDHRIRAEVVRLGVVGSAESILKVREGGGKNVVLTAATSPAGIAAGTVILIGGAGAGYALSTDLGRWKFFMLLIPLYTRIKKDAVLDNFQRGRIYQYILMNPGDHFSHIKKMLALNSGTLTYHLSVLERREFIKSRSDGRFRRFYPFEMRVEQGPHRDIQELILAYLANNPGISQREIANALNIHVSTVNYHVNMMVGAGLLRSSKEGRIQLYEVQGIVHEMAID